MNLTAFGTERNKQTVRRETQMISSYASKLKATSMKTGMVPLVSAFNRGIVTVGTTASAMNACASPYSCMSIAHDHTESATSLINERVKFIFSSVSRKSARRESITSSS